MHKILFVTSEVHPLIKTGGLADVSRSLPQALRRLGHDVRILLPGYSEAMRGMLELRAVGSLSLPGHDTPARLLEGLLPETDVPLWLLDAPGLYNRRGGPYANAERLEWPDNPQRFAYLSRAAVAIASDAAGLRWRPDIVHCNDWQTGLVAPLLADVADRPACVLTIHNLAYQGLYSREVFDALALSPVLWSPAGLEFYGKLSLIKGGLCYADMLTTVSPGYAEEILKTPQGCGLEGLLTYRADRLRGILNGADYGSWDPASDPLIPHRYDMHSLPQRHGNKLALQRRFGLAKDPRRPLLGFIGGLIEQKGVDLIVQAVPELMSQGIQLVVLGTGEAHFEARLRDLVERHPTQLGVHIGYDEALAHTIEAGVDIFLIPSRREPCGLSQLYSLRYGAVPIVNLTGGLRTIVNTGASTLANGTATGFCMANASIEALFSATRWATALWARPDLWQQLMRNGMRADFSWDRSAEAYQEVYAEALRHAH